MRSDAYVTVVCDTEYCLTEEDVELTALAHEGSYDMRNVTRELEGYGWTCVDGKDFCPECSDLDDENDEEDDED